jgi:hypothetical protein
MGIGYTRNDTTNNIANGNVISAADLDGEFDAVVAAFVNTTGHTHDGTTAEGGAVTVLGPVQEYLGDGTAFYPKTTAVYTLGKASNVWSNLYLNTLTLGGTAVTSTAAELNKLDGYTGTFSDLNKIAAVTATAAELNVLDGVAPTLTFTELNYVDGVTSAIQTQLNNKQPLSAVLTATTASFLLADETKLDGIEALADVTDVTNVTAAGALMDSELTNLAAVKAINQSLVTTASPTFNQGNFTTVDTTNLEVTTLKAKDGVAAGGIASVTGVTTLNSAVLTTADINGGTVDNASIGATTRSTGLFTTLGTNSLATLASVDINGGNIDATAIGAATRSTGLFTTLGTNSLATLASVDINGGNIDGTVIGAATPAAVTTSSLVATTADINGGTVDGTTIGATTPAAGTFTDLTVNGNAYPSAGALSSRTVLVNGDMRVAQRGTSKAGKSVTAYSTVDRFRFSLTALGTWTETQENTGGPTAEFPFSVKYLCTAANASPATGALALLQQALEGQNLQHFKYGAANALDVTLSFWVKSNKTGTYTSELTKWYSALRFIPNRFTIDVAGTWEYKTIVISGDTANAISNDNSEGLALLIWFGAGATYNGGSYTADTWHNTPANRCAGNVNLADTVNNYIQITGVQLEVGDTATPFEHRSYGQELALCQRYFKRYGFGTTNGRFAIGAWGSASSVEVTATFPTTMRAAPSLTAPLLGRALDYSVAWNNVTSIVSTSETTADALTMTLNTETGGANQGDAAVVGGGGNIYDYTLDAEL